MNLLLWKLNEDWVPWAPYPSPAITGASNSFWCCCKKSRHSIVLTTPKFGGGGWEKVVSGFYAFASDGKPTCSVLLLASWQRGCRHGAWSINCPSGAIGEPLSVLTIWFQRPMHGFLTPPWAAPRQSSHPYVLHDACCSQSLSVFTVLFLSLGGQNAFAQKAPGTAVPTQASLWDVFIYPKCCSQALVLHYNTSAVSPGPHLLTMNLLLGDS